MRGFFGFLKTTALGGFFVVVPVALVLYLAFRTVMTVVHAIEPLADELPIQKLGGVHIALILAALVVLGVSFATGLFVRTRIGGRLTEFFETNLLNRIPGYTLLRGISKRFSGIEENALFAVATVAIGDGAIHMLGFIVEEHANGDYTMLIPNAPTPNVGVIYYVKRERVHRLNVPLVKAVNCIMQWGVESRELFKSLSGGSGQEITRLP